MSEFNDRMQTQRQVINLVNHKAQGKEELLGLSSKAIDRWVSKNAIDTSSGLVELLRTLSGELLCLATKSQEQISEEYRVRSSKIEELTTLISKELVKKAMLIS